MRKSLGPHAILLIVLKICAFELAPIAPCFLPSQSLRDTEIFPIANCGAPFDPNSYHSISLSSIISKVFGTIISDQLHAFLEREGLLGYRRCKFRQIRSIGGLSYIFEA